VTLSPPRILVCYMQTSCRYTSSSGASTSGRDWRPDVGVLGHLANTHSTRHHIKHRSCRIYTAALGCRQITQQQASCLKHHFCIQRSRQHIACQCSSANGVSSNAKGPVIVIDNYDSFTYNLCQVMATTLASALNLLQHPHHMNNMTSA